MPSRWGIWNTRCRHTRTRCVTTPCLSPALPRSLASPGSRRITQRYVSISDLAAGISSGPRLSIFGYSIIAPFGHLSRFPCFDLRSHTLTRASTRFRLSNTSSACSTCSRTTARSGVLLVSGHVFFFPSAHTFYRLITSFIPGHCYLMQDDLQKAYAAYQQALYLLPNPKVSNLVLQIILSR